MASSASHMLRLTRSWKNLFVAWTAFCDDCDQVTEILMWPRFQNRAKPRDAFYYSLSVSLIVLALLSIYMDFDHRGRSEAAAKAAAVVPAPPVPEVARMTERIGVFNRNQTFADAL